jgi:hypothetical protein
MDETERVTDHAPVARMPDAAKSLGLPPELVNVQEVGAFGSAKCHECDRRVDEHSLPLEFQDEDGRPIEGGRRL